MSDVVTITANDEAVLVVTDEQIVVVLEPALGEQVILSVGEQGPPGAQGQPGPAGAAILSYTAAIALGGHRVVVLNSFGEAIYADNTVAGHGNKILGLTTGAASSGATASVQNGGEIEEGSWGWILDQPVYLATNGLLTQTPPESPAIFSLIVGFPVSTTKLFIGLREPIFLN